MKQASADLTIAEQQQLEKQESKIRYHNRRRDKRRADGDQRIRPIIKRAGYVDEDLIGVDLRRVQKLSDLPLD